MPCGVRGAAEAMLSAQMRDFQERMQAKDEAQKNELLRDATEGLRLHETALLEKVQKVTDRARKEFAIEKTPSLLTHYFYIPGQLGETNKALQDAHNLLIWFDSNSECFCINVDKTCPSVR